MEDRLNFSFSILLFISSQRASRKLQRSQFAIARRTEQTALHFAKSFSQCTTNENEHKRSREFTDKWSQQNRHSIFFFSVIDIKIQNRD